MNIILLSSGSGKRLWPQGLQLIAEQLGNDISVSDKHKYDMPI